MTTPTSPLLTLHALLTEYPLSQPEVRRSQELIQEVLTIAHEDSGTEMGFEDFAQMLPASLVRVLVELVAPVADDPHAGMELDFTLQVLHALTSRLAC